MENIIDFEEVANQIQNALYETFNDMSIQELKLLDWLVWENMGHS